MIYYNYILFDPRNNEPFYVGKGKGNRYAVHFIEAIRREKSNKKLENKIRSIYKKTGLRPMILIINKTNNEQLSFMAERELILKYRMEVYDLGNITDGGEGISGLKHSEETRNKIKSKRALQIITEETRQKMRDNSFRKGKKPANAGKQLSEETKKKISDATKGRKLTEEEVQIRKINAKKYWDNNPDRKELLKTRDTSYMKTEKYKKACREARKRYLTRVKNDN